jgi:hypothetical protein
MVHSVVGIRLTLAIGTHSELRQGESEYLAREGEKD